jgi:hypothetical protein
MGQTFTLSLHIEDINRILTALSKMPFEYSAPLIDSIQKQVQPQIPQQPVESAEAVESVQ